MKKIILFLLIAMLSLPSCGSRQYQSAADMMSYLMTDTTPLPDAFMYINGCAPSDTGYISEEDLGYLYYGDRVRPPELDCIQDYCLRLSKAMAVHEIHIFKVRYTSDKDMLIRMLHSRADFLTTPAINPNNSRYPSNVNITCRVLSKGDFVFLVAGSDIQAILDKIGTQDQSAVSPSSLSASKFLFSR